MQAGSSYDASTDVYSFGVMLAEVVMQYIAHAGCKHVSYDGMTYVSRMIADAAARLTVVCPPLSAVLLACTQSDRASRCTAVAARDMCVVIDCTGSPFILPVSEV